MSHSSFRPRSAEAMSGRDLGDEYLFYDHNGDRVHILNGTAREIYLLCDGTRSVEEVARLFAERYEVDPETALRDAKDTIDRLARLGLFNR